MYKQITIYADRVRNEPPGESRSVEVPRQAACLSVVNQQPPQAQIMLARNINNYDLRRLCNEDVSEHFRL